MKRKQGISLIVLVITIIVMIVLAAAVVLTLNNTGIIGKANEAVEKTNLKEVEQLASIVWAEEFMDGKRGDTLKQAVLDKLKDYTDNYNFNITDGGVTVAPVEGETAEKNEYGFYYNYLYIFEDVMLDGCGNGLSAIAFFEDNTAILYALPLLTYDTQKSIAMIAAFGGEVGAFDEETNSFLLSDEVACIFSKDGRSLEIPEISKANIYDRKRITGIARDEYYIDPTDEDAEFKIMVEKDNTLKCMLDGEEFLAVELEEGTDILANNHIFVPTVSAPQFYASPFGDVILVDENLYKKADYTNAIKNNVIYEHISGNGDTIIVRDSNVITIKLDGSETEYTDIEQLGEITTCNSGEYMINPIFGGDCIVLANSSDFTVDIYIAK